MSLDIWSRDDFRNIILAAQAANAEPGIPNGHGTDAEAPEQGWYAYRAGYEDALLTLASAFGIPIKADGRLRAPGVVIPASRLSVSYRAEQALLRLLQSREEW